MWRHGPGNGRRGRATGRCDRRTDLPPREMTELYMLMFTDRVACWLASDDTDVANLESSVIGSLEILFRGLRAF